jgi:hypothetical protein
MCRGCALSLLVPTWVHKHVREPVEAFLYSRDIELETKEVPKTVLGDERSVSWMLNLLVKLRRHHHRKVPATGAPGREFIQSMYRRAMKALEELAR